MANFNKDQRRDSRGKWIIDTGRDYRAAIKKEIVNFADRFLYPDDRGELAKLIIRHIRRMLSAYEATLDGAEPKAGILIPRADQISRDTTELDFIFMTMDIFMEDAKKKISAGE